MDGFAAALRLAMAGYYTLASPPVFPVAIWFLAGVFLWSGITKLQRPALAAMAMVDFGIVRRVYPWLGRALGAVEVLLAVALVLRVQLRTVLACTAGLLCIFVALIVRSLWRGQQFACFCFGDADAQLSRLTLIRTLFLTLLAVSLTLAVTPRLASLGEFTAMMLQASSAGALLGIVALINTVPRLLRWNRDWLRTYKPGQIGGE